MKKKDFCTAFCRLLVKTERYEDLIDLEYSMEPNGEYVTPIWWDSINQKRFRGKRIDVTADSERALIIDVLHGLE